MDKLREEETEKRDELASHDERIFPKILTLNAHGTNNRYVLQKGMTQLRKKLLQYVLKSTKPHLVLLQEVQWVDFCRHVKTGDDRKYLYFGKKGEAGILYDSNSFDVYEKNLTDEWKIGYANLRDRFVVASPLFEVMTKRNLRLSPSALDHDPIIATLITPKMGYSQRAQTFPMIKRRKLNVNPSGRIPDQQTKSEQKDEHKTNLVEELDRAGKKRRTDEYLENMAKKKQKSEGEDLNF